MLVSVTAAANGTSISLPIGNVDNGYVIESIEGLDPVKANLASSPYATMDGEAFQAARRGARNIRLRLRINPDYAVTDVRALRTALYPIFSPETSITLAFVDSSAPTLRIWGVVESFESALFTKDPVVIISVICHDPDFQAMSAVTVTGTTVSTSAVQNINNAGSVPVGFLFTVTLNTALTTFSLYNTPFGGSQQTMTFSATMQSGDVIKINSVPGNKYATLTRAGVTTVALYGVASQSQWLQLYPGDNSFRAYAAVAAQNISVLYTAKYGGM